LAAIRPLRFNIYIFFPVVASAIKVGVPTARSVVCPSLFKNCLLDCVLFFPAIVKNQSFGLYQLFLQIHLTTASICSIDFSLDHQHIQKATYQTVYGSFFQNAFANCNQPSPLFHKFSTHLQPAVRLPVSNEQD